MARNVLSHFAHFKEKQFCISQPWIGKTNVSIPESFHHDQPSLQSSVPLEHPLDLDLPPGGAARVLHVEAHDGGGDYRVAPGVVLETEVLDPTLAVDVHNKHCCHHDQSDAGGCHGEGEHSVICSCAVCWHGECRTPTVIPPLPARPGGSCSAPSLLIVIYMSYISYI